MIAGGITLSDLLIKKKAKMFASAFDVPENKTRVTVLLGVNATGTNKLVPWVIDNKFRAQNKKILLLVDNTPSHFDPHEDEQDNNMDDDFEHDNFDEGSTSSSTSQLHRHFHKN
ncbi:25616_t:CDS:2 [Gigaspora margarita]|uniref:25616_t:CDS:1 n=1 Tax=Gigaspora margarita TaxID=4874 RepID=A0ABN7VED4_GIGMA|nr:25616_t:CDS:2 [Gigaspora margarita]